MNSSVTWLSATWVTALFPHRGVEWFTDPRFIVGVTLYYGGLLVNLHADHVLRTLRSKDEVARGERHYRIPRGGLYRYVTSPTYLSELFFSGALNQYAFDVADRHRVKLKNYGTPERFNSEYTISPAQLDGLAQQAKGLGVDYDPQGLKLSSSVIALRLKAGIARNIWGENGYYRVLLGDDRIYERAREALREQTP